MLILIKMIEKICSCNIIFSLFYSLAICFAAETIFDPLAAPLVNRLTAKWTMLIGAITSAIFTSCFLYLNEYVLYVTSALFGFGSAGKYTGCLKMPNTNKKFSSLGRRRKLFSIEF